MINEITGRLRQGKDLVWEDVWKTVQGRMKAPITKKNSTTISRPIKTSAPFLSWHMIMHGTTAWIKGRSRWNA
jgi:hypothetical protein